MKLEEGFVLTRQVNNVSSTLLSDRKLFYNSNREPPSSVS